MLELKKPGLYIANGKSTSVLIRVAGTAPCLTIIRGILLNDMERDGTITVLEKKVLKYKTSWLIQSLIYLISQL